MRDDFDLYPLAVSAGTLCVNATPRAAYSVVMNPRGIGPNQRTPGFDIFAAAMEAADRSVRCLSYEDARAHPALLRQATNIILVTEDSPLPGEDMPKDAQRAFASDCIRAYGRKCLVVGLRSPYELPALPTPISYLCAYSNRACSAQETARLILSGAMPRRKE